MSATVEQLPAIATPHISDRNAARFLRMSASRQMRFLHDLKYPKGSPQIFRQPYYAPAILGIREVIKRGFPGLVDARANLQKITNDSRRRNLSRVLESFLESTHAKRELDLISAHRYHAQLRSLDLRLSPHVVAIEARSVRYLYFHEKGQECDPEVARLTLEFGAWILKQNGVAIEPGQLELIDLFTGKLYSGKSPSAATVRDLEEMARLIDSLWPTIEP